ncbi:MAG: L-threonylcarbamoyladenylate synthase, partial [Planctomycetota bacterium]|nr:L-threonylcarbamoyladenylate synthase [Planctomycetota bacterium]
MSDVRINAEQIEAAAATLRDGGLVAFPTETVYGLGADATNATAVAKIFDAKDRPRFDPIIVHLADAGDLETATTSVSPVADLLARTFWPGPLTMVLPRGETIPPIVSAGLPTVGVRVPDHPIATQLIQLAGRPIAAPSANRFGRISPTTAAHVSGQLAEHLDGILDGGPCRIGVESTVVDLTGPRPRLLRHGGITHEQLQEVVGPVEI